MQITALFLVLAASTAFAQSPPKATAAPPPGVWAKLSETLDTSYTRPGENITAILQDEAPLKDATLPKGTKLTGTVVKSLRQDKQHPNAGIVLLFDTAVLKDGKTLPVRAVISSVAPSHADEIEKITVSSGDVTDASLGAAVAAGSLTDPNTGVRADTRTEIAGFKATSSIKGVLLYASPQATTNSGVLVALKGDLTLEKWTRMKIFLEPR